MGLSNSPGGVDPKRHKLHRNSLEIETNDAMAEKRRLGQIERFPMHVHKAGGLVREVKDEADLADAEAKGWATLQEVMAESHDAPDATKVSQMSIPQALAFIAEAKTAAELVEIEADEIAHGSRADVLAALAAAKDAVPAPKKAKPAAKPATKKK